MPRLIRCPHLLLLVLLLVATAMAVPRTTTSSSSISWLKQCFNAPGISKGLAALAQPALLLPQLHVQHVGNIDFPALKDTLGVRCVVFDKDQTLSYTYGSGVADSRVTATIARTKALFPDAVAILSNSVGSCDDDNYLGASEAEREIGLPVIRHKLKKPACLAEVRATPPPLAPPAPPAILFLTSLYLLLDMMAGVAALRGGDRPAGAAGRDRHGNAMHLTHSVPRRGRSLSGSAFPHLSTPLPSLLLVYQVGDRVLTDVLFANSHGMVSILVDPLSVWHDHPVAVVLRLLETRVLLPLLRWLGIRPRRTQTP